MKRSRAFLPHPLASRFVGLTLLLVAALGWLGWRLLQQDRALERQRTRDALEVSADVVAAGLLRALSGASDTLAGMLAGSPAAAALVERFTGSLSADAAVLIASGDRLDVYPRGRLLFTPGAAASPEPASGMFARGDSLEFRVRDPRAAALAYEEIARSRDSAVRAAALLRLGRARRKANEPRLATAAYDQLAALDDAQVNGVAAPVVARAARLALWRDAGDSGSMRREARELHAHLHAARWRLARSAFEFYDDEVSRALAIAPVPHGDSDMATRIALSDAAAALWTSWRSAGRLGASGARADRVDDRAFVVVWTTRGDRMAALVGGPGFIERTVMATVASILERQGAQLALTDDGGRAVLATVASLPASRVSRTATDTRLPWNLYVASDAVRAAAGVAERSRLLIAGVVVAGLLALLGTYAVTRAVNRELGAARLQSDFVAAVSHEFRTPLTSLRQLTEMLASGRVTTAERRDEYYETLRRETARLHRFVEALLEFGRADAGVQERSSASLDGIALVRDIVAEFGRETAAAGRSIELTAPATPAPITGDAEALGRALWNLLDNAAKYSPAGQAIQVDVVHSDGLLVIRVRDRGMGVPPDEQGTIWDKFQRGRAARERGIRGTGIGLAIVRQVVEAHEGSVSLESAPGVGSTFAISLPITNPT